MQTVYQKIIAAGEDYHFEQHGDRWSVVSESFESHPGFTSLEEGITFMKNLKAIMEK